MSDEVKQRVEALRKAKEDELYAAECKRKDELIQWEAEMILALEEYTDERIIEEYTDDIDKFEYLYKLLPRINGCNIIQGPGLGDLTFKECMMFRENVRTNPRGQRISYPSEHMIKHNIAIIQRILITDQHYERSFKVRYVYTHFMSLIEMPEYINKEKIRKEKVTEKVRIAKAIKDEEERIAKAKADEEERCRRQQILDETHNNIRKNLVDSTCYTFTDITLSDWDKRYEKQFISYNAQWGWSHYSVDTNNKSSVPCYTGMHSSFINYYEEGKVPFFTTCPTCNSPTKFNYLNMIHPNGYGGCETQRSCNFKEVYCENHYLYDSSTNKHYRSNSLGSPLHLNHPMQGAWRIQAWSPQGNWAAWDPSDPNGTKAAAEKKRKEAEEIQKQIAELQTKLNALQ